MEFTENDGSKSKHKYVNIWVKSADEDLQGKWITIFKLYDSKIEDASELGLAVNSMVSIEVKPSYRKTRNGEFAPSITNRLISIVSEHDTGDNSK